MVSRAGRAGASDALQLTTHGADARAISVAHPDLFAAALFRTYLSGDTGYAAYLTSTYASTEPDIVFYPDTGIDLPVMGVVAQLVLGIGVASAGFLRLRRGNGRRAS